MTQTSSVHKKMAEMHNNSDKGDTHTSKGTYVLYIEKHVIYTKSRKHTQYASIGKPSRDSSQDLVGGQGTWNKQTNHSYTYVHRLNTYVIIAISKFS